MPCKIGKDWIEIMDYEFFPATVYPSKKILASEIEYINHLGAPPELKIKNELIFISAQKKDELIEFGKRNNIKMPMDYKDSPFDIWDAILEKFLDTEFPENRNEKIRNELKTYGLDEATVEGWRDRVQNPMVGYNFGTGLWDWVHLGQWDMLQAHLLFLNKIGKDEFEKLYWESMEIALRAYKKI